MAAYIGERNVPCAWVAGHCRPGLRQWPGGAQLLREDLLELLAVRLTTDGAVANSLTLDCWRCPWRLHRYARHAACAWQRWSRTEQGFTEAQAGQEDPDSGAHGHGPAAVTAESTAFPRALGIPIYDAITDECELLELTPQWKQTATTFRQLDFSNR